MSNFIDNVNSLQDKLYGRNFDISDKFLPDNEIVKNIIKKKNPGISKEDADIMVDGPKKKENPNVAEGNLKNPTDKKQAFRGEVTTTIVSAIFPLPIDSEYYVEANRIKNEVRDCALFIVKENTEVIQNLITTAIKIASSISAIVVLIMAPPFNLPAAITLAVLIIETLMQLCGRIESILPCLEKIKQIELLVDSVVFDIIVAPINIAIIIINGILTPLQLLCGFSAEIKAKIEDETSSENVAQNCKRVSREIKKKQKELNKLLEEGNDDVDSLDEIEGLKEEILILRSRCKELPDLTEAEIAVINNITSKLPDLTGVNIEKLLGIKFTEDALKYTGDLFTTLTNTRKLVDDIIYVYDVRLPDGTILRDLDETALSGIKERYEIVFTNK